MLIKLPAMIADVIASWLIYKLALKNWSQNLAILFSMLYALNPAIVINSSVWGQVDGVFVLFILLYLMFLTDERLKISVIMFVIAVLIKPQALIFTPLLLFKFIDILIDKHDWKTVKSVLISGCCGLGVFIIGILPFSLVQGPFWIIKLYKETLSSYPYASLNAFNLFALTGGNWQSESLNLLFFTYKTWGYIFIAAIVIASAILYYKNKGVKNAYFIASFIMTAVFMLSSKMHERYLFPALILLLAAYVLSKDIQILWLYGGLSFTHFMNVAYILENNLKEIYHIPPYDEILIFVSVFNMILFIYMIKVCINVYINKGVRR